MKTQIRLPVCLLLFSLLCPSPRLSAQSNPLAPQDGPDVDKFLFIVSTTDAMKKLQNKGLQALFELIQTGINGHMRNGDTYGVWTCSELVMAGAYPMQSWDNTNMIAMASDAAQFVEQLNYDGRLRLDRVIQAASSVVESVRDVNIFVISEATGKIKGTPFDDAINKLYKSRYREVKKTKMPVVTTLIYRNGSLIRAGVTLTGEKINLPSRPAPKPQPVILPVSPVKSKKASTGRIILINKENSSPKAESPTTLPVQEFSPEDFSHIPTSFSHDKAPVQIVPQPLGPVTNAVIPMTASAGPVTEETQPQVSSPPPINPIPSEVFTNVFSVPPVSKPSVAELAPPPAKVDLPIESISNQPHETASETNPFPAVLGSTSDPGSQPNGSPLIVQARESSGSSETTGVPSNNSPALATPLTGMTPGPGSTLKPTLWYLVGGAGIFILIAWLAGYWIGSRRSPGPSFITRSMYRK